METHNETKVSDRDRQSAKSALLDELVKGLSTEKDLFGPEGLFTELKGALKERLFEAEMTEHVIANLTRPGRRMTRPPQAKPDPDQPPAAARPRFAQAQGQVRMRARHRRCGRTSESGSAHAKSRPG